jgi:predicted ATP-grasp superfamily ATP-dependent carboligase
MRILVTDGETRASLAAVRALGRRGHAIEVAGVGADSLAAASRHARRGLALGDPALDPRGWAERLERAVESSGAELVVPVGEVSHGTIYAFGLQQRLAVACPEPDVYAAIVDKHALLARAARLGLDVPRGALIEDPASLRELPEGLVYPVVLKARRSRWLAGGRWHAGAIRIADTDAALREARRDPGFAGGLLVQEFVPGHGEALFLLASEGRVQVRFAHRRLREKPPWGGVSVLRESIEPDPRLLEQAERLLGELRFTGVAMVEFRRAPDGRAALMEINPRLWGSAQLAIDAGVDFPSLLVSLHGGESLPAPKPQLGVRSRWLLGDVDHLLICLRQRAARERTGRSAPRVVIDFLRSFVDGSRLEVLRRDDWRPFLRELSSWVRSAQRGAQDGTAPDPPSSA